MNEKIFDKNYPLDVFRSSKGNFTPSRMYSNSLMTVVNQLSENMVYANTKPHTPSTTRKMLAYILYQTMPLFQNREKFYTLSGDAVTERFQPWLLVQVYVYDRIFQKGYRRRAVMFKDAYRNME